MSNNTKTKAAREEDQAALRVIGIPLVKEKRK